MLIHMLTEELFVIHSGHEALRTARRLVSRGWDYDSIVAPAEASRDWTSARPGPSRRARSSPPPSDGLLARRGAGGDQPDAGPGPPGLIAAGDSVKARAAPAARASGRAASGRACPCSCPRGARCGRARSACSSASCRPAGGHEDGVEVAREEVLHERAGCACRSCAVVAVVAERHREAPGREARVAARSSCASPTGCRGAPALVLLEALEASPSVYCRYAYAGPSWPAAS